MSRTLHYEPMALLKRCGAMLLAAIVVIADFMAHAHGGFPRVLGTGPVVSAVLMAVASYLVVVTAGLTLGLMRGGGIAILAEDDGLTLRNAWFARRLAWCDVAHVALDIRYGKSSHHDVIMVREASGVLRGHAIDTRLLAEPLDAVSEWVDAAERMRVARGGRPFVAPTTGLAGYNARTQAAGIAADIAKARQRRVI